MCNPHHVHRLLAGALSHPNFGHWGGVVFKQFGPFWFGLGHRGTEPPTAESGNPLEVLNSPNSQGSEPCHTHGLDPPRHPVESPVA